MFNTLKKFKNRLKTSAYNLFCTPNLVGKEGYIIRNSIGFYGMNNLDIEKKYLIQSWYIHPLKQIGPKKWAKDNNIKIPHRSKVKIIKQELYKIYDFGINIRYNGYLTIKLEDGQVHTIDYNNLTFHPYWEYHDVEVISNRNIPFVAKFIGSQLPVDCNNEWINIKQGDLVLVTGRTRRKEAKALGYSLKAFIYKDWRRGYGCSFSYYFTPCSLEFYY